MNNQLSPIVSVVMPTYNRADLLPDVIASVLDQDYGDLELLIVDDGSIDSTEQVITVLQDKDHRLRYKKLPENKGIGYARQAGLEQVYGKYVALADSDDTWRTGKLRKQVDTLENHPEIDILFADFWNINHITNLEGSGIERASAGMRFLSKRRLEEGLWLIESGFEEGILRDDFVAAPTLLIRHSIFKKVGGFNPTLMAVDHEFNFRAAALGASYAYHSCPMIDRHIYPSSNTRQGVRTILEVLEALCACRHVCESAGRKDLVILIDMAFQRNYISLMDAYSKAGNHKQVWHSYRKVVSYGFSMRDFVYFLVYWGGAGFKSFV